MTWTLPEPMLSTPVPEPNLQPGWVAELGLGPWGLTDAGAVVLRSMRGTEQDTLTVGAAECPGTEVTVNPAPRSCRLGFPCRKSAGPPASARTAYRRSGPWPVP
ncbi:hypothetical protein [Streptomyces sp. NPDC056948]|uniref:hypothetical protein n=1 Tax=Streptomyces sp. NPDC056948 TaxID=3345975 RepID=UPI00363E6666